MKKITKQQKIMLGFLSIIAIFVVYKQIYVPVGGKIKRAEKNLSEKEKKLDEARMKAGMLPQLKKEYRSLEEEVKKAERKLPRKKELPSLIRNITDSSGRYKVYISNIQPQKPEDKQLYLSHPFLVSLDADYHDLAFFLTEIGKYERIFNIKNLVLKTAGEKISANFTLYTYTSKEQ